MQFLMLDLQLLDSVTMDSLVMRLESTYDGHCEGMAEFMLQDLLSVRLECRHYEV